MSRLRHGNGYGHPVTRALQWPAWLLSQFPVESRLEDWLEKLLLDYPRSFEATERLTADRPDLLLATGTFRYQEPAVTAAALKLGIPTLAFVTSWDNPSTKGRMVLKYDGYLVWSEQVKNEMHELYPHTRHRPVYVVGAPQFDVFSQPRFQDSREEFCASQGLNPNLPYILYALGSPNFLQEHHGALFLAERIARGELGDTQMLVRPHPIHDRGREAARFGGFGPRVILQQTTASSLAPHSRTQDETQVRSWVNTFRHAAVLVNLSSTAAIDAALFDVPVVNLDYDPQPGQADQSLVKDINHVWTHFKPIAESGGVWLVANPDEMLLALRSYLANPEQHRAERRWMATHVCGYTDGRCGERMAEAVLDFARRRA